VYACHVFVKNREHNHENSKDKGKDKKNSYSDGFAELVIEESLAVELCNVDWCLDCMGGLLCVVLCHPYHAHLPPHRLEFC
jgi:hypothetical protein